MQLHRCTSGVTREKRGELHRLIVHLYAAATALVHTP